MFKGMVELRAEIIKGTELQFPPFDFKSGEPGVEKVVIEGSSGTYILTTVHFSSVPSGDTGKKVAIKVNEAALNRLAYNHSVPIEDARITDHKFIPLHSPPGTAAFSMTGHSLVMFVGCTAINLSSAQIKPELESASFPGEHYFGMFRSAILSSGPVERFMHLYNLLLMLHGDNPATVNAFIVSQDSTVPQTQHPMRKAGVKETIYSRLRNEFAHPRLGVDLATTKGEMVTHVARLQELTKKAIELHL